MLHQLWRSSALSGNLVSVWGVWVFHSKSSPAFNAKPRRSLRCLITNRSSSFRPSASTGRAKARRLAKSLCGMPVLLKILGVCLFLAAPIAYLLDYVEWASPLWGVIMLAFSLAAIPSDYTLNAWKVVGWVVIAFSVYIVGNGEFGTMTLLAFVMFVFGGAIAGLPFRADQMITE